MSYLVRADWGGKVAWMRRAPSLLPLRQRTALVVGLGSLGSPLVINLARAGVSKLHLVDRDSLQVGNTIRWALGWQYTGWPKAQALAHHIACNFPYTSATPHFIDIGRPSQQTGLSDYEKMRKLAEASDIVVDASASHRINHFLADLAQELGKPYVWLTTTHGAAGGTVGRIIPGKTDGCWHCFQHRLSDESLPLPADSGAESIQPGGCSQATFIGAALDSDEVAQLASRLTVATLASGENEAYPDFEWNVAIGDFTRNGVSLAPQWTTDVLRAHSSCLHCNPL